MVRLDAGWSDLGAWESVWSALPKDAQGNAHVGDVLSAHSHDTLVHASSRLVSVVGVSHLVVIETPEASTWNSSPKTNPPTLPPVKCTAWPIPATCRSKSLKCSRAAA